jgi:hypothetical protein
MGQPEPSRLRGETFYMENLLLRMHRREVTEQQRAQEGLGWGRSGLGAFSSSASPGNAAK